jgi:hypothetical protein
MTQNQWNFPCKKEKKNHSFIPKPKDFPVFRKTLLLSFWLSRPLLLSTPENGRRPEAFSNKIGSGSSWWINLFSWSTKLSGR